MISRFFIERPKFSFVVSIVITLAGLIAMAALPVTQYPNIVPSQVQITATYPGADAMTVQQTVIEPIEAQVNGVKDMLYMSSTSSDSGAGITTVTFAPGASGDMNTVNVQNRVNWASANLPDEVRRQGVIVKEKSSNMLLVICLYSPNGAYDSLFLSNYAAINVQNEISRIPGVSDVNILGEMKYSMRIWLDPDKMASLKLTVDDVGDAIKSQNIQVSAGAIGDLPCNNQQMFRLTVQTQGRLKDIDEFKNIVIRQSADGASVRIKDVAKVELGAENYSSSGQLNGKPSALLAVYQFNDANGLNIAKACVAKLEELKKRFPEDLACAIKYDTTKFIKTSISEMVKTLFEAALLVILITFIFLQDWRSTLIPMLAIPVSLIGAFAVLLAFGYTINLITLFALILAIGIVVDDAIVVIENANRLMNEEKLPPKAAALKTMEQVTGPVIATTLVLLAMFIPICFLPGITGEMYRQFGVTISVAVIISSINALSLSPALCALILRPAPVNPGKKFFFFRWFDSVFGRISGGFAAVAGALVRKSALIFLLYLIMMGIACKLYTMLPTGFIPEEDQGAFFVNVQLPDGAALPRTQRVVDKVTDIARATPGVSDVIVSTGFSILNGTNASNNAMLIIILDDWSKRQTPALQQSAILEHMHGKLAAIPEAMVMPFTAPAIPGLGSAGGFSFVIEDTTGANPRRLAAAANDLIVKANESPALTGVFSTFRASIPQFYIKVDREKALKMGVAIQDINNAFQSLLGYSYINDFNKFGKVYKVELQAQPQFRSDLSGLSSIKLRNRNGEMAPLNTLVEVETSFGPQFLTRYNMYSALTINGASAAGHSSGQAMRAMEKLADENLPAGMKYEWTDMSYQEKLAGGKAIFVFVLALIFIYLFLVAQYESWMAPLAVMLSVPIAFIGALGLLFARGIDNNIYTQVGFVLLFGLAAKTAILIVEFAKELCEKDATISPADAALRAAKLRFRAVVMTTIAFILGVLPLTLADGAGAVSRRALGSAVCGGMTVSCLFGTILAPSFFVVIMLLSGSKKRKSGPPPEITRHTST